jgi:hypothetical protein
VIYQEDTHYIQNELISLFDGSCCVFRAWLIRLADGEPDSESESEGGLDFKFDMACPVGMEVLRTLEWFVGTGLVRVLVALPVVCNICFDWWVTSLRFFS